MEDVVLRPSAASSSAADETIQDVVLRSSDDAPAARAGSTTLFSVVETIHTATTIADLKSLLSLECVTATSSPHARAVSRCTRYVNGLARSEEAVLCGWPVLSINEWGTQQTRTLVLTSHALYRVAFNEAKGSIDHYTRTSLGNIRRIERGRYAFKVQLTEPDGRENPFTYFWSAYVKKGAKDNRYERVYYPLHADETPVELVIACMLSAIQVANRILVSQVGHLMYVSRLEVADYVPTNSPVDDWMDKIMPKMQSITDKIGSAIGSAFDKRH